MKNMKNKKHLFIMTLGMFAFSATAQNPIVQTMYYRPCTPPTLLQWFTTAKCISTPATMKTSQPGSQ